MLGVRRIKGADDPLWRDSGTHILTAESNFAQGTNENKSLHGRQQGLGPGDIPGQIRQGLRAILAGFCL